MYSLSATKCQWRCTCGWMRGQPTASLAPRGPAAARDLDPLAKRRFPPRSHTKYVKLDWARNSAVQWHPPVVYGSFDQDSALALELARSPCCSSTAPWYNVPLRVKDRRRVGVVDLHRVELLFQHPCPGYAKLMCGCVDELSFGIASAHHPKCK